MNGKKEQKNEEAERQGALQQPPCSGIPQSALSKFFQQWGKTAIWTVVLTVFGGILTAIFTAIVTLIVLLLSTWFDTVKARNETVGAVRLVREELKILKKGYYNEIGANITLLINNKPRNKRLLDEIVPITRDYFACYHAVNAQLVALDKNQDLRKAITNIYSTAYSMEDALKYNNQLVWKLREERKKRERLSKTKNKKQRDKNQIDWLDLEIKKQEKMCNRQTLKICRLHRKAMKQLEEVENEFDRFFGWWHIVWIIVPWP